MNAEADGGELDRFLSGPLTCDKATSENFQLGRVRITV